MRRLFWKLMYPFTVIGNRHFGLNYKWVNVARGAWTPTGFNPLWHYEWYGDPIPDLPKYVILHGIGYETEYNEACSIVSFVNTDFRDRITFNRNMSTSLWYVSFTRDPPASHIATAYKWVQAVFGGSFEFRIPVKSEEHSQC